MFKAFFRLTSTDRHDFRPALRRVKLLLPTATATATATATVTALFFLSCGLQNAPIDADTRLRIDSTSNAQIAQAQLYYDSLCKSAQLTLLPHLVDSIKQVRLREIEAQLKTIPK